MSKIKEKKHLTKTNKHLSVMDKVKIKRVKKTHKKISTKEKVLGGLGLGATLIGGVSQIAPQQQNTQFVRSGTKEEGTSTSKIKQTLKKLFGATVGVPQAKADFNSDVEAANTARGAAFDAAALAAQASRTAINNWKAQAEADVPLFAPEDQAQRQADIDEAYNTELTAIQAAYDAAALAADTAYNAAMAAATTNNSGAGSGTQTGGGTTGTVTPTGPQEGDAGSVYGRSAHYHMLNGVMTLVEDAGHRVLNDNGMYYVSDGTNNWTVEDIQTSPKPDSYNYHANSDHTTWVLDNGQHKTESGVNYTSINGQWVQDAAATVPVTIISINGSDFNAPKTGGTTSLTIVTSDGSVSLPAGLTAGSSNTSVATVEVNGTSILVTALPNTTTTAKSATVTVSVGGITKTITVTVAASTATATPTLTFTKNNNDANTGTVKVGDSWKIEIKNGPKFTDVYSTGGQVVNGQIPNNNTKMGTTDANGYLLLTGTFSSGQIGVWHEGFVINGSSIGTLDFTIISAIANTIPGSVVLTSKDGVDNSAYFSDNDGSFRVGYQWQLNFRGTPQQHVFVRGGQNGNQSLTDMGTLDGNGILKLTGTFTTAQIGSWQEDWFMGDNATAALASGAIGHIELKITDLALSNTPYLLIHNPDGTTVKTFFNPAFVSSPAEVSYFLQLLGLPASTPQRSDHPPVALVIGSEYVYPNADRAFEIQIQGQWVNVGQLRQALNSTNFHGVTDPAFWASLGLTMPSNFTPGNPTGGTQTGPTQTGPTVDNTATSFSFRNLSNSDNSTLAVGEQWQIDIHGPSAQKVFVTGGKVGLAPSTTEMGTLTNGVFTKTGVITAADLGANGQSQQWTETWFIGTDAQHPTATFSPFSFTAISARTSGTTNNPPVNNAAPAITTSTLPAGVVGTPYSYQIQATGGSALTYSVSVGNLPAGLSLSSNGTITGTPTTAGSSDFAITVRDTQGFIATKSLTITVTSTAQQTDTSAIPTITLSQNSVNVIVGQTATVQASVTMNNTSSNSFTVSSSNSQIAQTSVSNGTISIVGVASGVAIVTVHPTALPASNTSQDKFISVNVTSSSSSTQGTSLTLSRQQITMGVGNLQTASASVLRNGVVNHNISVTTSSSNIYVTADSNTGIIDIVGLAATGNSPAIITVHPSDLATSDTSQDKTISVTVTPADSSSANSDATSLASLSSQIAQLQARINDLSSRLGSSSSTTVLQTSNADIAGLRAEIDRLQATINQMQSSGQVTVYGSATQLVGGLQMPTGAATFSGQTVGTYTVKKGDNLWNISKAYYGTGTSWRKILEANPNCLTIKNNPRTLRIGVVLVIPKL